MMTELHFLNEQPLLDTPKKKDHKYKLFNISFVLLG